jgi:hypothetical protein
MKTLNEQIDRIKSVMGLISEQGRIPGQIGDGRTKFENCRGIKAGSRRDRKAGTSDETEVTWTKRAQKEAERYLRKEEEAELKAFNKQTGLNLDKEYYTVLRDDSQKVNAYNNTKRYNLIFDESGKPFTKNMTQKIANDIESLFVDGSVWYFYWRDVFGNKTPSIMDIYNYVQNLGGKKAYINLVNSNYNVKDYRQKFYDAVELAENELKSKFPFQKPSGPTPFYIMWFEGKDKKFRYFNSYEEWNLSIQIMEEEGNRPTSGPETNGTNSVGSASFSMKPSQGTATPQLLK